LLNQTEQHTLNSFFTDADPFAPPPPLQEAPFTQPVGHNGSVEQYYGVEEQRQLQLQTQYQDRYPTSTASLSITHPGHTNLNMHAGVSQYENMAARTQSSSAADEAAFDAAFPSRALLVPTPQGYIREELASVLPNHSERGSIDARVAAQLAQTPYARGLPPNGRPRQPMTRSYTYGTDTAFNSSGYAAPIPGADAIVEARLTQDVHVAFGAFTPVAAERTDSVGSAGAYNQYVDDDGEDSEKASDEDQNEGETGALTRTRTAYNGLGHESALAAETTGSSRRAGNTNGSSMQKPVAKRKLSSTSGPKTARENLSEEQKRNNHIKSEQKRRNTIKQAWDDIHDLVPELWNDGLSKCAQVQETLKFLRKLMDENKTYRGNKGAGAD
jgi:hypothetical protein